MRLLAPSQHYLPPPPPPRRLSPCQPIFSRVRFSRFLLHLRSYAKTDCDHVTCHVSPGLTYNVQKMLMEMDGELYDQCAQQYEQMQAQRKAKQEAAERDWEAVSQMVALDTE